MQTSFFESISLRKKYAEIFKKAYKGLNEEQRIAVDRIDGPVMVIAGPGTGKTQILAMRIGKILLETDTAPHNILCLTYTDAATISMRNRLVQIIGPDAHRVHIYTFHAFCNQVIQDNLGLFGNYRQLEPVSDLERVEIFKKLIRDLPNDHKLKRLKGDPQYEMNRLKNLFSLMKKENYQASDIEKAIEENYAIWKEDPKNYYSRKVKSFKKGDIKQNALDALVQKMDDLLAGARLFDTFQNLMEQFERYDYDDMISWVLRAFETEKELLLQYQERYHYFLVDEFQDTNGSQKQLLDFLINFWEDAPNVFVVGDDDQAIYKFQGANMGNIKDFKNQYDPFTIVLSKNYRSNQQILNAAMGLIDFNQERIVKEDNFGLDKNLLAMSQLPVSAQPVQIKSFANIVQEEASIANQLEKLHKDGADLSKIAILYRKHRQVEKLVEVLEKKNIPLNIKRRVDILKMPLIRNVLNILIYVNSLYNHESGMDRTLFEIMHYNFFNIKSRDVSLLMWELRKKKSESDKDSAAVLSLRNLIGDKEELRRIGIVSESEIGFLDDLLDKWVADINDVTLQVLFQNVINEGQILKYILQHPDKSWLLQVIGTMFDLIKNEMNKKPDLSLSEFLKMIENMSENKLPLAVNKIVSSEKGVHFLTAHASKGLEFNKVIVVGATKDIWDQSRRNNNHFSYPQTINGDNDLNTEDERRLMYVAMTRAEQELEISYSLAREDGKELGSSQFVDELLSGGELKVSPQTVEEDQIIDYQYNVLLKQQKKIELIDHELIDRMLDGYKLSVTGLNKYLKCPITFYFESVLKVPMARTKHMGFGRAIHYALECHFDDLNNNKHGGKEDLIKYFEKGMNHHRAHFTEDEFKDMTAYGQQILSFYFKTKLPTLDQRVKKYELEVKIDHAEYEGVPIKGVLDKVAIMPSEVVVTDYKTGNPNNNYTRPKLSNPSDRNPNGGDYWRQIVFYKTLLLSDRKYNWDMTSGIIDFVEPDRRTKKFTTKEYVVSDTEIKIVGEQIKKTWGAIQNHEFEKGCGEDDCKWCEFVQNDYVMNLNLINDEEYDEEYEVNI